MKKIIVLLLATALLANLSGCFLVHNIDNRVDYIHNKIDEYSDYDTIKKVEDACRAMIASYEADKLTYEQYKDSTNEEKQSWAEQAKLRANQTASTYNNYILENSFVWSNNVPKDIRSELPYIE